MSHRIIKARPVWKTRLLQVLVILFLVVLCVGILEYGRIQGGYDRQLSRQALEQLEGTVLERDSLITRLREEKAIQQRSTQIEREAYKRLEGTVNELRAQLSEQEEELTFYRGIISPKNANAGLRIDDFELGEGAQPNSYHYKLVLTQVLNNSVAVSGTVDIRLEGTVEGKEKLVDIKEISVGDTPSLKFRFKYFQNLEGDIVLPEGFIPGKIIVKVIPRGSKHKRLEKSIDWPQLEKPNNVG